ncbi:hypothetical protein GCM10010912_58770 [Paenibacillus albidus]|uniref:Resolvase/invertase-type recombinase catalytic domain-containing protein n=1 Tax=Paenibacillus albidus TaxID=2041023 RepID=A0A917D2Z0_9BACL|nr:hypothetical protein GCM10010912_58770 [Paenibacillus albidus]
MSISRVAKILIVHVIRQMRLMIREGDLVFVDALDRLGRDYDGIIAEWKHITREIGADIVCLDNETLLIPESLRQ